MSRATFDKWYETVEAVPGNLQDVLFFFWRSGRESMRDEAAAVASDEWVKDHLIPASDAIKRIEP